MSQFFLGQVGGLPEAPEVCCEHVADGHERMAARCRLYSHGVYSTNSSLADDSQLAMSLRDSGLVAIAGGLPGKQVSRLDTQDARQASHYIYRRGVETPFKRADVGPIQISQVSQLLLRKAAGTPRASQVCREKLPDRHPRMPASCRIYHHGVYSTKRGAVRRAELGLGARVLDRGRTQAA